MIDFNKFIDRYLHREFKPKKEGIYYPSEIGGCLRKVWFSYKYPIQTRSELIRIFEVGNILHDFVVNVLKSERNPEVKLIKSEFPFRIEMKNFIISGRIDNLLLIMENNKEVLVEVKSTNNLNSITEPLPNNIMQLQFYMHALGVHNGILLYIEKATLQSKVFVVDFDESIAKQAIERFKLLHKFLKEDIVPIAEAKKKNINWMCSHCEYKELCNSYP